MKLCLSFPHFAREGAHLPSAPTPLGCHGSPLVQLFLPFPPQKFLVQIKLQIDAFCYCVVKCDPLSSSGYPMITYTLPVASNLPIKNLVARRLHTSMHTHNTHIAHTRTHDCFDQKFVSDIRGGSFTVATIICYCCPHCYISWTGLQLVHILSPPPTTKQANRMRV